MWKTFRDFLWPHSYLQIKVMWALLRAVVWPFSPEPSPAVCTEFLPLSLPEYPSLFDSLVYRSFSWNLIWQHPAFYKLTECRHFFKKNMWLNLLERGILYYSRETRCIDQPACPSVTWEGIFWTIHTVKPSKFAECVLKRTERKLQMQLLFALVPKSFFLQRNMFHACDNACRLSLT